MPRCLTRSGATFSRWAPIVVATLASTTLGPLARAGADCSITTTGTNFGAYDPFATLADDTTATITVTCTYVGPGGATAVNYSIAVSNGLYGSSAATRSMGAGVAHLAYNVYLDAARAQILGTGVGSTVVATGSLSVGPGVGNGTRTATHTFYGRASVAQDVEPGAYADSLVLTLTY
jgi:spore coat protein U-like protein